MRYKFIPSIAAIIGVECEAFPLRYGEHRTDFIFLSEGKLPDKGIGQNVEFCQLPLKVRAEINKHFGTVFSIPVGSRGLYLKQLGPWEIDVEGE